MSLEKAFGVLTLQKGLHCCVDSKMGKDFNMRWSLEEKIYSNVIILEGNEGSS